MESGNFAPQRINKIAGAAPGVAVRQHTIAMLLQDAQANGFRGMDNSAVRDRAANGRCQRDDGSDVFRPARRQ